MSVLEISSDRYHADDITGAPCLSASIANLLLTASPAHARAAHPKLNPFYERKTEEKYDLGTALHSVVLEGKDRVYVIHEDSWRTKTAKEARDYAREMGRIPMLAHQWEEVQPAFDRIREQLGEHEARPVPFSAGKAEQTLVWEEDGVSLKARLDWLHDDRSAVDDLKSTKASAERRAWSRTCVGMGADVQAAMYLRGCRAYGWNPLYRWVVVEVSPPFALNVFAPDAATLAIADDKLDRAITLWRRCMQSGKWPGYPRTVQMVEPLPWSEAQWLERREEMAA